MTTKFELKRFINEDSQSFNDCFLTIEKDPTSTSLTVFSRIYSNIYLFFIQLFSKIIENKYFKTAYCIYIFL